MDNVDMAERNPGQWRVIAKVEKLRMQEKAGLLDG